MAALYINARCREILNILLGQTEYMTLDRLAKRLGISKRSAYYDICKINVWMEQIGAHLLEVKRGHGLLISLQDRARIEEFLSVPGEKEIYIFSPEERVKLMIAYMVHSSGAVFIEQLTSCCEVSRSTAFNDLKEIEKRLEQYDLKMEYQPKTGYTIVGNPVRIRALFILYFKDLLPLYRSGVLKVFDRKQIEKYYAELRAIESELGFEYVDGILHSIAALMPVMALHKEELNFPGWNMDEIRATREFQLACTHFPELHEEEKLYLTLHLLGSRTATVPQRILEDESWQSVSDMAVALVSEFERVACVKFDARESLIQALCAHLKTSLYRYCFGIQIGNLLCNDIKREYPELFSITKIAAKRMESTIELPIPDEEIAYLALHFGAFLKIVEPESENLRILIVCVNGISTGNMIRREVKKLLPQAEIVGVAAAVDVQNAQEICNLIISTIKMHSVVPVITVHPVMTAFDRSNILNHRVVASRNMTIKRDTLFEVVKKYVAPENYEKLLADLTVCLQSSESLQDADVRNDLGLLRFLDSSRISIWDTAKNWRDSIRKAGQCLLECGSIDKKYLDTVISQIQYYGPYMFLTEDVIVAHAKPEDGVNCLDVSLSVFHKPVVFAENRKAKMVFFLAAEDQEKHLKILQDILVLVSNQNQIDALADSSSVPYLLSLMKIILEKSDND